MPFLFLLLLIRLIPGTIVFYIFFRNARHSLVDIYQVVSSLVLYYDIQDLKKALLGFGEFLFLHVAPSLLDGPVQDILLFDVAAVIYLYFGLHGHQCNKVKNICFG